jgi:hypothetical protein
MLTTGVVAFSFVVGSVLAGELLGMITKVDEDARQLTVVEKGSDKEVLVKINDDTEYVTPKRTGKVDLGKVSKNLERAKEKGRKGIAAKITHEDGVASKIEVQFRKKAAN